MAMLISVSLSAAAFSTRTSPDIPFSTVHLTATTANVWAILFEVFLAVSHAVFYQGFDVTGFLSEDVARYFDNVDDGEKLLRGFNPSARASIG